MIDATKSRKSNVAAIGAVIALAAGAFAGVMMWPHSAPVQTVAAQKIVVQVAAPVAQVAADPVTVSAESDTDRADMKLIHAEEARQRVFEAQAAKMPKIAHPIASDAPHFTDAQLRQKYAFIILLGRGETERAAQVDSELIGLEMQRAEAQK